MGLNLLIFTSAQFICKSEADNARFSTLSEQRVFIAEINTTPVEKAKSYRCEISVVKSLKNSNWEESFGKAIVYFEKDTTIGQLLVGDRILVRTTFNKPMGSENPDGFDYSEYLLRNGISATAYISSESWKKIAESPAFSLRRTANQMRNYLLQIYEKYGIGGDEFAVLAALTLGYTDELNPDLRADYSATGAMHILSVSGLHIGIVYFVIAFLLRLLGKNRFQIILKAVLIVLFLWTYAFVTGLSPSVVRSALMFSFVAIGTGLERKSQIYNTVFMSAFIMLIINPNLIYDIGFQLSYAAVISILIFQKPFASLLPVQHKILRWLRDLFTVSIAAQLGTLPFTLYYFQQFPSYFLLTNLIAIPLSTIIIYLAMTLLAISSVTTLAGWTAFVLKWLIWAMNYSIEKIHELPQAVLTISPGFLQMILLFIVISSITMYFYTKKYIPLLISLLAVAGYGILLFSTVYRTAHTERIIVYSSQKALHINFIQNGQNLVYTNDSNDIKKIAAVFWKRNHINTPVFVNSKTCNTNNYLYFMQKRIVIANERHWKYINPNNRLYADILIIGEKIKPKISRLFENITPKTVVVDKSIPKWYTENIRKECLKQNIAFYSIPEKGAFEIMRTK